ncbi:MAG: hypothetical protein D6705_10580 [Deltaproteobacteria bacterium]|nr:MAG: hypothetical protein D6705_10580 [Deltaproteobacteria bacterium]
MLDPSAGETGMAGTSTGGASTTAGGMATTGAATTDGGGPKFDVNVGADIPIPCGPDGEDCKGACLFPEHTPCDAGTDDLFTAMGLGCPGEPVVATESLGSPAAHGVIDQFGNTSTFAPREGSRIAVIGSGRISDLFHETPDSDNVVNPLWCNTILPDGLNPGASLPAPLVPKDVGNVTCDADLSLVGTGDCSNTIQGQFDQGQSAYDYADLRVAFDVPQGVKGFSFDFAYLTVEYPKYYQTGYNDMFVGWLESESWTGNISFDEQGNPISLNASFLEFLDDDKTIPEFAGTCMKGHAGTNWLTTSFPLTEGEHVELVFAIFDLQDARLDSYVLLDNFHWECEKNVDPGTKPVG